MLADLAPFSQGFASIGPMSIAPTAFFNIRKTKSGAPHE